MIPVFFRALKEDHWNMLLRRKPCRFQEALSDEYMEYILQVSKNAKSMAEAFQDKGYKIISGGTDNHLMLNRPAVKKINRETSGRRPDSSGYYHK